MTLQDLKYLFVPKRETNQQMNTHFNLLYLINQLLLTGMTSHQDLPYQEVQPFIHAVEEDRRVIVAKATRRLLEKQNFHCLKDFPVWKI